MSRFQIYACFVSHGLDEAVILLFGNNWAELFKSFPRYNQPNLTKGQLKWAKEQNCHILGIPGLYIWISKI